MLSSFIAVGGTLMSSQASIMGGPGGIINAWSLSCTDRGELSYF